METQDIITTLDEKAGEDVAYNSQLKVVASLQEHWTRFLVMTLQKRAPHADRQEAVELDRINDTGDPAAFLVKFTTWYS